MKTVFFTVALFLFLATGTLVYAEDSSTPAILIYGSDLVGATIVGGKQVPRILPANPEAFLYSTYDIDIYGTNDDQARRLTEYKRLDALARMIVLEDTLYVYPVARPASAGYAKADSGTVIK